MAIWQGIGMNYGHQATYNTTQVEAGSGNNSGQIPAQTGATTGPLPASASSLTSISTTGTHIGLIGLLSGGWS